MSHTKGKWVVDDREDLAGKFYSDDATGSIIGECQHYYLAPRSLDERKANAKRIVDCVNACDGMGDPADEIAKLRSNIDELLKELDVLSNGYPGNGWDVGLVQRLDSARNLVKKLKGKRWAK